MSVCPVCMFVSLLLLLFCSSTGLGRSRLGRGRASCRISIGARSTVEIPESTNHCAGFIARHAIAGVSTGCRCLGHAKSPIFDSLGLWCCLERRGDEENHEDGGEDGGVHLGDLERLGINSTVFSAIFMVL